MPKTALQGAPIEASKWSAFIPTPPAGGREKLFRHGQPLAFDQKNNYPIPNLYLSVLHRLGLQEEKFATSTGGIDGLEV